MEEKRKADEDTIFIGQKPVMVYVTAITTRLVRQGRKEIKVVAMGKSMLTAIDAVEIAIKNYLTGDNAVEKNVTTGTKAFEDGGAVSSVEIVLKKMK